MTDQPRPVPAPEYPRAAPEYPRAAEQLWSRLREQLRWQMEKGTYDSLLRGSEGVKLEGHTLVVEVRNPRALSWLNERLMPNILRTARMLADPQLEIRFTVEDGEGRGDTGTGGCGDARGVQQPTGPQLPQQPDAPLSDGARVGCGRARSGAVSAEAAGEPHGLPGVETAIAWTDIYIKMKVAFRKSMLTALKGPPLSAFLCLALHMNQDGRCCLGIETIMRETGYGRASICEALDELESLRLIRKQASREGADKYSLLAYAWLGKKPAPALYEIGGGEGKDRRPGM